MLVSDVHFYPRETQRSKLPEELHLCDRTVSLWLVSTYRKVADICLKYIQAIEL